MNENKLKSLWQSANQKEESVLKVNSENAAEITRMKAKKVLATMKPVKLFLLVFGALWVVGLGSILVKLTLNYFDQLSIFFLVSASIQVSLTAIAIGVYIYQLFLIQTIDFSGSLLDIQRKILKLELSSLNVTRILFLQLPVWTTFYWNEKMFVSENWVLWSVQGIITLLFTYVAVWLYFNIKFENRNKKWFQLIFRGKEWQPILQSMEFISEIEQHEAEDNKE